MQSEQIFQVANGFVRVITHSFMGNPSYKSWEVEQIITPTPKDYELSISNELHERIFEGKFLFRGSGYITQISENFMKFSGSGPLHRYNKSQI